MITQDLLRDNPFRATALPSTSSLAEVKAALKRHQVQARAGLGAPQPLESALGRVEAAEAQRLVKELEKNPGLLAACRLLWPLQAGLPAECQTLAQASSFLGRLGGKDLHTGFLGCWFAFLGRADEDTSKALVGSWDRVCSDPVSRAGLEEGLEPWDVDEGVAIAAGYLASEALSRGAREWREGRHGAALAVLEGALEIHEAAGGLPELSRWVELAEQGLAEIDGCCEAALKDPSALQKLEPLFEREVRLLQALSPRTAEGPALMRALHRTADRIGIGLQEQALELIQKRRDLAGATRLLTRALRLPISAEGREILSRDLAFFQGHLSGSGAPRPQLVGPAARANGSSPSATPGSSDSGGGTCLGCLGLLVAFVFFANVAPGLKARNPRETPPPPPAVSAPAAPASTYADGLVAEYQALASEVKASRPGLEVEQEQLEALRAQADQLEAEIEAAKARESYLSPYEIDEANRKIGRFNDLVVQVKNRLTEFNAKVDRHNQKVERAKSLEAELRSLGRIR